jgi:hypothetical protein
MVPLASLKLKSLHSSTQISKSLRKVFAIVYQLSTPNLDASRTSSSI